MIIQEKELLSFCRQLICIESVSGKEERAAYLIRDKMMELLFDEVRVDRLGNVIGKINGLGNGPVILLEAHMDTVALQYLSEWTYDPFGAEVAAGRIYGKGSSITKGSLSAMLYAVAQLKRSGIQPGGDIYLVATVLQEVSAEAALKEVLAEVRPDFVIVGQPTELNLSIGQAGIAEIIATAKGLPTDDFDPTKGFNAVVGMLPFLNELQRMTPPEHELLGKGMSAVISIMSLPVPKAPCIPDQCSVKLLRTLLDGEEESSVLESYRQLDDTIQYSITERMLSSYTGVTLSSHSFYPAWLMDVDHPYVKLSLQALHGQGIAAKIISGQRCSSGSYSAGVANIPTIGFGPCNDTLHYKADEYIEIDQLMKAFLGYFAIIKAFAVTDIQSTKTYPTS